MDEIDVNAWRKDMCGEDQKKRKRKSSIVEPEKFYTHESTSMEWQAARRKQAIALAAKRRERERGVWREFSKQAGAMAYVDAWPPCTLNADASGPELIAAQRLAKSDSIGADIPAARPRLWSIEVDDKGCRRYIVAHWDRFRWEYTKMKQRFCYELIREESAVRPYFDCEFTHNDANAHLNGPLMVQQWIQLFLYELQIQYSTHFSENIINNKNIRIIELDATTVKKFSRHVIITLPQDTLFADTSSLGAFVRFVLHKSSNQFQVFTDKKQTSLIDVSVYSRNRLFRLCASAKRGKTNAFALINFHDPLPAPLLPEASLVVPVQSATTSSSTPLLRWGEEQRLPASFTGGTVSQSTTPHTSHSRVVIANGPPPSPFAPYLDDFVLASRPGARIRSWRRLAGRGNRPTREGKLLFFLTGNNRYCENIRRSHKSNNIYMIVDLADNIMVQACHDIESCRAFRGFPVPFPIQLKDYLCDILATELTVAIEEQGQYHDIAAITQTSSSSTISSNNIS